MGVLGKAMAASARRSASDYLDTAEPPKPGILSTVLQGAQPIFDVLDVGDRLARGLAGRLTGYEGGTGAPTIFGQTPSGEELFQYLSGVTLPPNIPGKAEWRDVPGFATEVGVSPWNAVGIGPLSKAGKAAKTAAKLTPRVRALEATGRGAAELKTLKAALQAAEATPGFRPLGRTLMEQGRQGQRALLGIGLPGREIPLGGRMLNTAAFAPFTAAAAGLRRVPGMDRLGSLFRVGGRLGTFTKTGDDLANAETYNALVGVGPEEYTRMGRQLGVEQQERIGSFLGGRNVADDIAARERVAKVIGAGTPEFVATNPRLQRLRRKMDAAYRSGNLWNYQDAVDEYAKEEVKLLAQGHPWAGGIMEGGASNRLLELGLVSRSVPGKVETKIAALQAGYAEKTKKWRLVLADPDSTPAMRGTAQSVLSRMKRHEVDLVARLQADGKLKQSIFDALPREIQEEAARIDLLQSKLPRLERMAGARSPKLADAHVGYMYRAVSPEGRSFSDQLAEVGGELADTPYAQFHRLYKTEADFTKRRIAAFEGKPAYLISHEARQYADQVRKSLTAAGRKDLAAKITFGLNPADDFFVSDVGETVMQRLVGSGRLQGNAALFRGVAEAFSVPEAAKAVNDVPLEDFLERTGLAHLSGVELAKSKEGIARALKDTRFEGLYVPKDIAEAALKIEKAFQAPDEIAAVARVLDTWNSALRFGVTALSVPVPFASRLGRGGRMAAGGAVGAGLGGLIGGPVGAVAGGAIGAFGGAWGAVPLFPAYTIRNALSNGFAMYMAGANPLKAKDAARLIRLATGAARNPTGASAQAKAALDTIRKAHRLGAIGDTFTSELEQVLRHTGGIRSLRPNAAGGRVAESAKAVGRGLLDPSNSQAGRSALEMNTWVENVSKLAMFLDGKAKGMADWEAAERVKKYLFDYSQLGPADNLARRVAYFWTFQRKAVPLYFERLVGDPRKMRLYGMATGKLGDTVQKQALAGYQQSNDPIALTRDERGNQVFINLGLLPVTANILSAEGKGGFTGLSRIAQKMASQASPPIRAALESTFQTSLESGKPTTVQRELGSLLPTSRIASTLRRVAEVTSGERPQGDLGSMLGATPIRARTSDARLRRMAEAIQNRQQELASTGQARRFSYYDAPYGKESPELDDLNRKLRRIQTILSKSPRD